MGTERGTGGSLSPAALKRCADNGVSARSASSYRPPVLPSLRRASDLAGTPPVGASRPRQTTYVKLATHDPSPVLSYELRRALKSIDIDRLGSSLDSQQDEKPRRRRHSSSSSAGGRRHSSGSGSSSRSHRRHSSSSRSRRHRSKAPDAASDAALAPSSRSRRRSSHRSSGEERRSSRRR